MKVALVHVNYNRKGGGGMTYAAQVSKILKEYDDNNLFEKADLFMISKAGKERKGCHIHSGNTDFEIFSSSYKGRRREAIEKLREYDLIHMTTTGSSEYKDGSYQTIIDEVDCPIVMTFHDARDFKTYNGESLDHWEKYIEEGRLKIGMTMSDEVYNLSRNNFPILKIHQSRLPYIPKQKPEFDLSDKFEIISTCRISAEKGLDKFAYAMKEIEEETGFRNWYMYSMFTNGLLKDDLFENIPNFEEFHYKGMYEEEDMPIIFEKAAFQVDLMNVKNDGADAQYSQLEAVNYFTIPIVMENWCRDFHTFDVVERKVDNVKATIKGAMNYDKKSLREIMWKNYETLMKFYRPQSMVKYLYNIYKEALS